MQERCYCHTGYTGMSCSLKLKPGSNVGVNLKAAFIDSGMVNQIDLKTIKDEVIDQVDKDTIWADSQLSPKSEDYNRNIYSTDKPLVLLLNDYKSFGYSTLEIESHLNKLYSLPIYVTIMTILGSIFMLNVKYNKSKIFSVISGTLISVLIYYLNYFSNVMGVNEKLPIVASTWFPYILLTLICITGMIKINEK